MKSSVSLLLALLTAATHAQTATGSGQGIRFLPEKLKPPVAAAQTDKNLKLRQQTEKFGGFAPDGSGPKGWDLLENSEFITFNSRSTLLPKGAILYIPEKLRSNVVSKPVGNLMVWTEFAATYRGLVTYLDVTLEQASGQAPIPPDRLDTVRKAGLIVIATLDRNPVSVSPKALPSVAAAR